MGTASADTVLRNRARSESWLIHPLNRDSALFDGDAGRPNKLSYCQCCAKQRPLLFPHQASTHISKVLTCLVMTKVALY
jgi:hypothetical protein